MLLAEDIAVRKAQTSSLLSHVGVIIPTFDAELHWSQLQSALARQGLTTDQILVIDSGSADRTVFLALQAGYKVVQIAQREFNHGGTRQIACSYFPQAQVLLFLTQDAIPATACAFASLCQAFERSTVGAAYGRQLPRPEADPIERHARLFNYPAVSELRTLAHRETLGLKAAFLSNSFAAYRRSALEAIGGFPCDVILAEDSIAAARLLRAGWQLAYVAQAAVIHSHAMSFSKEFTRYFDTGVHHCREAWLLQEFGSAGGEGKRFVLSELRYLRKTAKLDIPAALLRTGSKWFAYQLGRREKFLPLRLKRQLSASSNFWQAQSAISEAAVPDSPVLPPTPLTK